MSRSVKDLRELICVSRLTNRASDDEGELWDSDDAERLIRPDTALSVRDEKPQQQQQQRQQSKQLHRKPKQLPPLEQQQQQQQQRFDALMSHIDAEFVAQLLQRADNSLTSLTEWTSADQNFLHFANFWLTEFPEQKKSELLQLEHDCLADQFAFAFRGGTACGRVKLEDVQRLLGAVLREYPKRLLGAKAAYAFLDTLRILAGGRGQAYKQLLTDVKLSTDVRQHAEWLLALRSFALSSVWTAVVEFYRQLLNRGDVKPQQSEAAAFANEMEESVVRCVGLGYVSVLHYFILTGHIDPYKFKDSHGRNLIFLAVSCAQHRKSSANQLRILKYLLKSLQPQSLVNAAADTGNTALHMAVTGGSEEMTQLLVIHGGADVNVANQLCDGCTPLHLAVMYGHTQLVIFLVEHGADAKRTMGSVDCLQLAQQNGDTYLCELLTKSSAS